MEQIYVALDLEMTGLEAEEDEIIEIGAVKFQGATVLATYSQLINPRGALPLNITRITGITREELEQAPRFEEVAPDFVRFIENYPIVGHYVENDLALLQAHGVSIPQPIYDTFHLATLLLPNLPTYKLTALAKFMNIPHQEAHRALNDAEATRQVFSTLLKKLDALSLAELIGINRVMRHTSWSIGRLFAERERERLHEGLGGGTTATPGSIASLFSLPTSARTCPELVPLKPTGDARPLDLTVITKFFSPQGAMGTMFPGYEQRSQQIEMACSVATAFNEGQTLVVEAGTGIGKSMAYLVPAVMFAVQRGERVVISTNTINLQDQLFYKDIPDLQSIMQRAQLPPFTAALLKGRSHYLCLYRYEALASEQSLTPEEAQLLLKVYFWLPTTTSGDGATEIAMTGSERQAWNRLNVPADACTGPHCKFYTECFFFKARRWAETTHLLIVNHALLLADLNLQRSVLPPYDHVIIDEAHNLESVATEQFSFTIDQAALLRFLDSLGDLEQGNIGSVRLEPALFRATARDEGTPGYDPIQQAVDTIRTVLGHTRRAAMESFRSLEEFLLLEMADQQQAYAVEHLYDIRYRITPQVRKKPKWTTVEQAWSNLEPLLRDIGNQLGTIEALMVTEGRKTDDPSYEEKLLRIQSLRRFATDVRISMGYVIQGHEEHVVWLSLDQNTGLLSVHAAPINVESFLRPQLFEQKRTCILASATLSIDGTFDFVCNRLGILQPQTLHFDSPYDYERQALIYIPNDIPEPSQRGYQEEVEAILVQIGIASGGRTLVLFTANSMLKKTIAGIQGPLEAAEILVLGQGVDGSRRTLLERFRDEPRTMLLGTSSFWEGVDISGEALSVLVITRLPFHVPTDPVFAARSEQFANPFLDYAVPLGILRFKQGFGRLIRSKEDRGVAVVLDRRLLSKKYGRLFLQSLPPARVREGPSRLIPHVISRFLAGQPV